MKNIYEVLKCKSCGELETIASNGDCGYCVECYAVEDYESVEVNDDNEEDYVSVEVSNGEDVATVLWFSERDGNGIIKTLVDGKEFYVDISAIPNRQILKRDQIVVFKVNTKIRTMRCAIITKIY